jgi:hypothetical protein
MKRNLSGKITLIAACCLMAVLFSSCNRGYGCPYELKAAVKVIAPVIK